MRWTLLLVLLCPGLLAETLTVHGEAGAWRFSFRVPGEAAVGGKPALGHSDFRAWHHGRVVSTTNHILEFTRGPWGYTLSIQPSQSERRFTLFNHTSLGELWFATAPDVLSLRPGWYRFGDGHTLGHTLGLGGAHAIVRIEGELETSAPESSASSFVLLLAGLLAGAWITGAAGRPNNPPQPFPEPCVGPGNRDQNHA